MVVEKYLSPITFEAELFANNLETLSKKYNTVDAVLLVSLERVMDVIEKFIDSNPVGVLGTAKRHLVKCNDVGHIKRKFYCAACKKDLGKCIESVTTHLQACQNSQSSNSKDREQKALRANLGLEQNADKNMEQYLKRKGKSTGKTSVTLSKRTRSLLCGPLNLFVEEQTQISHKLKCLPDYDKIENELQCLVASLYPNETVKIYKFGSRIAGIGSRESDLDLYVDIGRNFNVFQSSADTTARIRKLRKVGCALKDSSSWKGLVMIEKARVPILKVMHNATGIECDINFSNSLGIINTQLLEYIFILQPIAKILCCFMRKWLHCIKLTDINTYSISLMVLFYLQTVKVIPSIENLQKETNPGLYVGPWLCSYNTCTVRDLGIVLENVDQPNVLRFIRDFFQYYRHFNFDTNVISPYLGVVTTKKNLEPNMPFRYTDFIMKNRDRALDFDKPIVVQDPIELNHNTTKNISAATLNSLKSFVGSSLALLDETFLP